MDTQQSLEKVDNIMQRPPNHRLQPAMKFLPPKQASTVEERTFVEGLRRRHVSKAEKREEVCSTSTSDIQCILQEAENDPPQLVRELFDVRSLTPSAFHPDHPFLAAHFSG